MFRRVIPFALRAYFQNRREIRKSLQTYEHAVALKRARALAVKFDHLSDLVEEIDDLQFLKDEYQQQISELAAEISSLYESDRQPFEEKLLALLEQNLLESADFDQSMSAMSTYANRMLELTGEHKSLSMKLEALERLIAERKLSTGNILLADELGLNNSVTPTAASSLTTQQPRISEIITEFITFKREGKKTFGAGAVEAYESAIEDLIFIVGDLRVDAVTFKHACLFRDYEQRIPKHRRKNALYIAKTCDELIALDLPLHECISARTTSDRLGYLRTIFSWLITSGRIDRNPFDGVNCEYDENPTPSFTEQDLTAIFSSDLYIESPYSTSRYPSAAHWWLPLLSLWTGARPSELTQMRIDDVQTIDGILVAEVVDDEDTGQRTKSKAARRIFPIHPTLLNLGFEDYLQKLRATKADRVLDSIKLGSRKPGSEAGKWFNERYREKFLPPNFKAESKVLYSFRCTYITEALNSGVELRDLQQMVGHEKEQLRATKHYDRGQTIHGLRKAIEKIQFPTLNLSHLLGWQHLKRL